jgi:O-antigen ligase
MIDHPLNRRYSHVVNVLIFIFPIVINSLQVAGDIVLFILAMMGIYVGISQKLSPFHIKEIKVFSYLTFGYFIAVCLSVLFSSQAAELAHYIPRDFYFLFAPFIALALYKAEINMNYLLVGVKVSLLVMGGIAIEHGGVRGMRIGVMNAGVFGNLAVLLFFIALVFPQYDSLKHKAFNLVVLSFNLVALSFGLVAVIVSQTRGAWLTFLLLLVIYTYFFYKKQTKFTLKSKILAVLFIASIISIGSFNQIIKDRSNLASTQISNWMNGDLSPSSVGLRLNMYKKAVNNIEDVPFFGYGLRTSNINLFKDDSSSMGVISARFNHLHNAFLTNYYNGGIFLLGALLLILFVPMIIFVKANSQNRTNPVFIAGVLLTVGYASIGMINILLGDTYMNGFYTFFLAIFMLLYAQSVKISST